MWTLSEENIEKRYFVPILSRGFFIAAICYLVAFLVPLLVLVSIGYSWSDDSKSLLKPTLKYENYQVSCLLADQSSLYDSSFLDDSSASQLSTVSVGVDADIYSIAITVQGSVLSCTVLTYNRVLLNILVTIPLSFYHSASNASTNSLKKLTQRGKIEVFSPNSLLDSTIPYQQTTYHSFDDFSMIDNAITMSNRNLSAFLNVGTYKKEYGTGSGFEFVGYYEIESELFVKSESLLNKIRSFVPFYMYVWFPVFFFVVLPLVRWMFSTKLYNAKCDKGKIKME